jgi:hypothetical protein
MTESHPKFALLLSCLYGVLDNGLGLKYCQYVLPQPIGPDLFDASLLLRFYYFGFYPRSQVLDPKSAAVGVSHGSLVVVRVRRAEEIDTQPESLRYN